MNYSLSQETIEDIATLAAKRRTSLSGVIDQLVMEEMEREKRRAK